MSERSLHVLQGEGRTARRAEVDDVLREIAGLVRRRDELRRLGAGERELERHRDEIVRLQWRLARAARESTKDEGPEAA